MLKTQVDDHLTLLDTVSITDKVLYDIQWLALPGLHEDDKIVGVNLQQGIRYFGKTYFYAYVGIKHTHTHTQRERERERETVYIRQEKIRVCQYTN